MMIIITGAYILSSVNINLPGNNQGYAPVQPIEFSHRLHSGDLEIDCQYCHSDVDKSRYAGIPSASTCMNCHKFVTALRDKQILENDRAKEQNIQPEMIVSDELQKLYTSVGFDIKIMKYDSLAVKIPIRWLQVHKLPDFVYFEHRAHITAEVNCTQCHGNVANMERIEQIEDLSMGWCINCHRDVKNGKIKELEGKKPSIDCGVCHY